MSILKFMPIKMIFVVSTLSTTGRMLCLMYQEFTGTCNLRQGFLTVTEFNHFFVILSFEWASNRKFVVPKAHFRKMLENDPKSMRWSNQIASSTKLKYSHFEKLAPKTQYKNRSCQNECKNQRLLDLNRFETQQLLQYVFIESSKNHKCKIILKWSLWFVEKFQFSGLFEEINTKINALNVKHPTKIELINSVSQLRLPLINIGFLKCLNCGHMYSYLPHVHTSKFLFVFLLSNDRFIDEIVEKKII